MLLGLLMLLIGIAFVGSLITLAAVFFWPLAPDNQDLAGMLGGFSTAALWGIAMMGSTSVKVCDGGTCTNTGAETMVFYIALVFAVVMAVIGIGGALYSLNVMSRSRGTYG